MKKIIIYSAAIGLVLVQSLFASPPFRTESFSGDIKTLRVNVVDDWQLPPIIQLEGGKSIEISFDELNPQPTAYTYTLTHCNADWTPSRLVQSEYMSGFQHSYVEDYTTSFNTTMDYTHYKLFFPNENLTMKISGNYVVRVYIEKDKEHPVLTACFSVIEPEVNMHMQVTSKTDKGVNQFYQQVNFELTYENNAPLPLQDLKVYVFQNDRSDNQASSITPLSVQNKKLIFDHHPDLIFDGGNEYRSFEMITPKYNGLGIETVEFHAPYYHTVLKPNKVRAGLTYSYEEDINGKYVIRSKDAIEYDFESDYQFVHFHLPCEERYTEDVYLLSEAFNNILDSRSQMEYSVPDKGYIKTVLLKEGYYNYLYLTKKSSASHGSTALIEGNFFQTENTYKVLVYYRPMGAKYDKLIGMQIGQFE